MTAYRLLVNGEAVEVEAPGMRRLLDVLREDLDLTGTKEGCGEGECGACSVLIDGMVVDSCLVPICQVDGHAVQTVEGLAARTPGRPALSGLQQAFLETGGAQCGICTPGMLMAAHVSRPWRWPRRGCDPRGDRRQPLSLHRLHEDHRCDRRGCIGRQRRERRPVTLAHEPPAESPRSLAGAYALLADGPWRPVAGGTDLLVQMAAGTGDLPDRVLDLARIEELRGIAVEDGALVLGAMTTYTAIRRSAECREHVPALVEAAATIGAAQIQNRGTLGGNIANASPAGDTLPVLLATDATFDLGGPRGERTVAAGAFWTAYRRTALAPDELVLRVRIPLSPKRIVRFRKVGTRRAQAISKVVMALAWQAEGGLWRDVRLALGSVAATPIRAPATEAVLEGAAPDRATADRAAAALAAELEPIDDVRSTAVYRRAVAGRVLHRMIRDAGEW